MDTVNIKKYFYQILSIFAALLLAFSIAQIPVQAAAKPGTVKLSSIKAVDYMARGARSALHYDRACAVSTPPMPPPPEACP